MPTTYLTEIRRLSEERRFMLTWNDGFSAELDYDYVRGHCPCAGCQGHSAGQVVFRKPPAPVSPVTIEPVGNYAISIAWSDGHSTGIYRFDFLREICPAAAQVLSSDPRS